MISRRVRRRWYLFCFGGCVMLGLTGCPTGGQAPSSDAPCRELGARCRLPDGPLGVCAETTEACETPPCLVCRSQH